MDDRFGVTIGLVPMSSAFQTRPQFTVVINLAVEDDPDRVILIRHGLMAIPQVDNAKAPVRQANAAGTKEPGIVGPTMRRGICHELELVEMNGSGTVLKNACYPTHCLSIADSAGREYGRVPLMPIWPVSFRLAKPASVNQERISSSVCRH
jgi:hypothetical protein